MSAQIKINLPPESEAKLAKLQALPTTAMQAIARAMDQENQITEGHIRAERLTGQGPYPVEEHRLGRRSGRLRESLNASPAVVNGTRVVSGIGSNVIYAALHEFGATFTRKARKQKVRLGVDAKGNLLRQLGNSNLAIFARREHKRVRESVVNVAAHEVVMPERAPVRTGIRDCIPNYQRAINKAIASEMK